MDELLKIIKTSPFATSEWMDWVDVAVLTLVVYGVLSVLRGTRAFQILAGLVLLSVMYLLSAWMGLSTLHWVLDNLVVYAVIGVLVLFAEDIRQVLATAGGTIFLGSGGGSEGDTAKIEAVIQAAFVLANRRIGALVALERQASLSTWVEQAHVIDAVVSSELLAAIFHPSSPIHDGAVVIERGRIGHAGAFLPISLETNLPKAFGTRHRAAIGLTDRTDAVCVLVSEERGTVAVVAGGVVTPVVDANDLRQRLQEALEGQRAPEVASA